MRQLFQIAITPAVYVATPAPQHHRHARPQAGVAQPAIDSAAPARADRTEIEQLAPLKFNWSSPLVAGIRNLSEERNLRSRLFQEHPVGAR
jgi:hypothetical protein